ncbi:MAG: TetR family transcriptional regulator [Lentisphaerae bacterium]|nr:TetR family transcriptional regulator [Lentisphaerota bacterium]
MAIRHPKQDRSIATRALLLEAATETFSEHGYDGTRVDAIAQRAGANKQLLYAYFGNKQALYEAVITHVFDAVTAEESSLIEEAEAAPEDLTKTLIDGYRRLHRHHPHFWRLLSWNNLESAVAPRLPVAWKRGAYARLAKVYRAAQAAGMAPASCSFKTYIFTLSALTFFQAANQHSMSDTLNRDLTSPAIQARMQRELLAWLSPDL